MKEKEICKSVDSPLCYLYYSTAQNGKYPNKAGDSVNAIYYKSSPSNERSHN